MEMSILDKIRELKLKEVEEASKNIPMSLLKTIVQPGSFALYRALEKTKRATIAEVKWGTPFEGQLGDKTQISDFIKEFSKRAVAISVFTDSKLFLGSTENLSLTKHLFTGPIIRNDFILDEYQVYESRYLGADAIYINAALNSEDQLRSLTTLCRKLKMDAILEVSNEKELKKAMAIHPRIVCLNHKDLQTFEKLQDATANLAPDIPHDVKVIAGGGISTQDDYLARLDNADAVIIGTALVRSPNVQQTLLSFQEPYVKICGITNIDDALATIKAGAHAIGLIFVEESPRYVDPKDAQAIVEEVRAKIRSLGCCKRGNVSIVGTFANTPIDQVLHIANLTGIDTIQLHGSESLQYLIALQQRFSGDIIKAIQVSDEQSIKGVQFYPANFMLFDSKDISALGGTGKTFNWDIIQNSELGDSKILLSGGITPENVAEAYGKTLPYGVDVCTGTEISPGKKDLKKIEKIIANLYQSWMDITNQNGAKARESSKGAKSSKAA